MRPEVPPALRCRMFADSAEMATMAAAQLLETARVAIATRGVFHLVLAGGSTPLALYERLAQATADWRHWQIWFGDERCAPDHDPQRNDHAIDAAWFEPANFPREHIHAIPASRGADEAARLYAALLPEQDFDLVLLGLGADGHTASLFPGRADDQARHGATVLAVHDAPKPPPQRVTLSAQRLSRSRQVWVLVTGRDKAAALAAWRRGASLPIATIQPAAGLDVWMDRAAAGETPRDP